MLPILYRSSFRLQEDVPRGNANNLLAMYVNETSSRNPETSQSPPESGCGIIRLPDRRARKFTEFAATPTARQKT